MYNMKRILSNPGVYLIKIFNRIPALWCFFRIFPAIDSRTSVLKKIPRKSVGAEIGVWRGDFSDRIYYIVSPKKLYLVDPWQYNPKYPARMYGGIVASSQDDMDRIFHSVCSRFAKRPEVEPMQVPSVDFFSRIEEGSLDFIYIDGNHSYEYVLSDLESSKTAVRSGGIVTGDDVFWKDTDGSQPVKSALDAFSRKHGVKYSIIGNQFYIEL